MQPEGKELSLWDIAGETLFSAYRRTQGKPVDTCVPFAATAFNAKSERALSESKISRNINLLPGWSALRVAWECDALTCFHAGEMLEIYGRSGSGKTEMLYQTAVAYAMPH